ncbi:MAG: PIN domain-containing protein [bacterium]
MLVLDTNIVVFFLTNDLNRDEQKALSRDSHWAISAIVLWELAQLCDLRRVNFTLESPAAEELLTRLEVLPLTLAIALQSRRLDFKSDPADEIIAATSIVHRAPLVTRDARLLASRIVPLAG